MVVIEQDLTGAAAAAKPQRARPVVYPASDGKPMAETDKHRILMARAIDGLAVFYSPRAESVYVSGNNFLYWREGDPRARVSPDVYVVFGVPQKQRDSYKAWEEDGHLPAFVLEVTSKKTRHEDVGRKFTLYEQTLRVPEYFPFDPTGDYLSPRLQGYRLNAEGRYVRLEMTDNRIRSEQLGLDLVIEGDMLRFFDPQGGRFLPTLAEADAQARENAHRADAAQAEADRLREVVAYLQKQIEEQATEGRFPPA